jgi:acetyl esterase
MAEEKLDPRIEEFLKWRAEHLPPPLPTLSPAEARETRNPGMTASFLQPERVGMVADRFLITEAGEVPVRMYTPSGNGPWPVLVFFHGGGWVLGNLETHDALCRALTNSAQCLVMAVDYGLAPEHKYPAGVNDAYGATSWMARHAQHMGGDPRRIAVGGDSAGGNLATVVCLKARDQKGPPIRFQLLVYPILDLSTFDRESYHRCADRFVLTRTGMEWFRAKYLNCEEEGRDPHVSPLLAPDLSGLPPALVIAAQHDVLTDEVREYSERLREAGVPVTYSEYRGMIHAFFGMGALDRGSAGVEEAAAALRDALCA